VENEEFMCRVQNSVNSCNATANHENYWAVCILIYLEQLIVFSKLIFFATELITLSQMIKYGTVRLQIALLPLTLNFSSRTSPDISKSIKKSVTLRFLLLVVTPPNEFQYLK